MEIYANSLKFKNDTERINWETKNKSFIKVDQKVSNGNSFFEYTIDTWKFFPIQSCSKWIADNSNYLDFDKSSVNIESSHLVNDSKLIGVINKGILSNSITITAKELQELHSDCFVKVSYYDYMLFELDNKTLKISKIADYDESKDCYSYPFFWSILKNNNITDLNSCVFTFSNVIINGPTLAFTVEFSKGTVRKTLHYDFSHNPPNGVSFSLITILKSPF